VEITQPAEDAIATPLAFATTIVVEVALVIVKVPLSFELLQPATVTDPDNMFVFPLTL
jgi:hypothetical protein